ncbi:PREDICTED: intraflagellar transport protein 74 homolog [Dufourea novaeangliae]|uniref:intraflagellar transport protein 74 homolog n=1 Tax=Dufourea novaeangliae TaxID=178035 RepID=UPI000767DA90|nr:PREDICTED: intraflagellar transport protein 74 homolog [Dufourea novaeangliae]
MQRPSTGISVLQNKFDKSRRLSRNELGEYHASSGSTRPATPGQNVLARPPSTSVLLNQTQSNSFRLPTSSSNSIYLNSGIATPGQTNINVIERPITQHGVAGVRPGTGRGLSMMRQIQDKRYYSGLMQLKMRDLNQEIAILMKNIEDQNKERATYLHYDKRAKDLATELTTLQGQLADYNIVVDKMTSDIGKEIVQQETEELATKNEQSLSRIENMFEERKQLEQQLNKLEKQLENEKKRRERLVESMNLNMREKYNELLNEKASLQEKTNKMQQTLDELSKEQVYLEEEIVLSPLKQEAVKLQLQIIETEEKRGKLKEEEEHRISPEEEKEKLLQKVKQDNIDIAAAEAQLAEKKKAIEEIEHELELLETDIEDTESEKQIKYNELRKREEVMEQFMSTFEQNKQDETKKLYKLEKTVIGYLGNISSMLDTDIDFVDGDEMAILNNIISYNNTERVNNDQNSEGLTKENVKLQHVLNKMEMLEQRLKVELSDLNETMNKKENKLTILEDISNLKSTLSTKQEQLLAECERLKKQQSQNIQELKALQLEYDKIKERLTNNEIYIQINVLENTVEKLVDEHKNITDSINKQKKRFNYGPVKEDTLNSMCNYNTILKDNLKTVY